MLDAVVYWELTAVVFTLAVAFPVVVIGAVASLLFSFYKDVLKK
jgi:hypothetical protein